MWKTSPSAIIFTFFLICFPSLIRADEERSSNQNDSSKIASTQASKGHFDPFTGKVNKNKVRLRLQPSYDGQVLKELKPNDYVVVLGETEDFYATQPPAEFRGYVYRTYVLDNVIEGNRVNVRLNPDLDSPVVAQLNSGDRVEGSIYANNNKWMEIKLPPQVRFYVSKEYIENIGDAGFLARLERRHHEVENLIQTSKMMSWTELQKPFVEINIEGIKDNYMHIIQHYPEFPEAVKTATELLAALQQQYTAKKIAYLESQTHQSSSTIEANRKLAAELQMQQSKIAQLENQIEKNRQFVALAQITEGTQNQLPVNMAAWIPVEENLFNIWLKQNGDKGPQDFYDEQKKNAFFLKGIIDPYNRQLKNKPGDYMLISASSKLPIAFLYSTAINLQDYIGHEVSILVSPRSNNHFAFPAYFVLSVE